MGGGRCTVYAPPSLVYCLLLKIILRHSYLKILDLANLFIADTTMNKKKQEIQFYSPQSTLKYRSKNRLLTKRVKKEQSGSGQNTLSRSNYSHQILSYICITDKKLLINRKFYEILTLFKLRMFRPYSNPKGTVTSRNIICAKQFLLQIVQKYDLILVIIVTNNFSPHNPQKSISRQKFAVTHDFSGSFFFATKVRPFKTGSVLNPPPQL